MSRKKTVAKVLLQLVAIQIGAFLAGAALEEFLVPNNVLDGGVVGVSIMVSYLAKIPLGILTFAINVPFILLGWRRIGPRFVVMALYAIASMSIWVTVLHPVPELTKDLFLASIFGGICLGAGVGLIIRNGGCLDGTEIIAILLNKRLAFSVGEIVMFINVFIFVVAGFIFGLDRALYSGVTYLVAYKMIDLVVEGIDESKSLFIITQKPAEISRAIMDGVGSTVTILKGMGGYSREDREIIYSIVHRLEVPKVKELAKGIDANVFISVHNVHEVVGRNIRKRVSP